VGSSAAAEYTPWDRLVAAADSAERRMLHELRRLCTDAGFDIDRLRDPANAVTLMEHRSYFRVMELWKRLARLGTWDRLAGLNAEYRAAVAPAPEVQTMIVYSPTDDEGER